MRGLLAVMLSAAVTASASELTDYIRARARDIPAEVQRHDHATLYRLLLEPGTPGYEETFIVYGESELGDSLALYAWNIAPDRAEVLVLVDEHADETFDYAFCATGSGPEDADARLAESIAHNQRLTGEPYKKLYEQVIKGITIPPR